MQSDGYVDNKMAVDIMNPCWNRFLLTTWNNRSIHFSLYIKASLIFVNYFKGPGEFWGVRIPGNFSQKTSFIPVNFTRPVLFEI